MKVMLIDLIGIALGLFSLCLHWFCPASIIEVLHGKVFFPFFSWILDHTIGLLPFPFFYILIALAAYWIYRGYKNLRVSTKKGESIVVNLTLGILSTLGFIISVFYFFWGFNYDRIQLQKRLSWQVKPVDRELLLQEADDQVQRLTLLTLSHRADIEEGLALRNYRLLESDIRQEAVRIANTLGYLGRDKVRCRQLAPSGVLLRISTAGFYNPLSGECNIDKGLHPLQKPFSMAHEFFHGMGVTGEGDCNFLAYLLCNQSNNDFIRYSGELGYWRYMRHSVYMSDKEGYLKMVETLPDLVNQDLKDIDNQLDKYPDIAPRVRDAIYGAYLKSNKIHDGLANYNRILQLVINWRQNHESL
ncbi:MAG: DUF3810 domain-containing protein [Saprospiraceae bacterium]|nr:DUF3810 domain-containing protein [Saprospiraceae bacterium]